MYKPLREQLAVLVAEREIALAVLQSQMDECTARGEIRQYVEFPGWQRYQDARSNVEIFRAANESAILELMRDGERYRWIRDTFHGEPDMAEFWPAIRLNGNQHSIDLWHAFSLSPIQLDEAIDKAIDSAMKKEAKA